jgi:uncharacterized protein YggE
MHWLPLALLLAFSAPAAAKADPLKDTTPNITVTGEAIEEAAPDRATILFGVVTEKPTAAEAVAENARAARAVFDELKAQGVEAKDISTRNVTLTPFVVEERDAKGVVKQTKKLFRARNDVSARIKALDKAGTIIGQIVDKGANSFQGIEYDLADANARRDALRTAAVKDAQRRAQAYVEAAGLRLGRVLDIKPEPGEDEAPPHPYAMRAAAAEQAAPAPPLAPGLRKLTERVTVTWALSR